MEQSLRALDRESRGRLVVALFREPEGTAEEFAARTGAEWQRAEPKLSEGAVLFYFTQAPSVHLWVGDGLAARVRGSALQDTVAEVFRGPGAFITFPDSIEKCVVRLSAQIRNALEKPRGGSAAARVAWRIKSRSRLARAVAGKEFGFLFVGAVVLLGFLFFLLRTWYRAVGKTIAVGKRKHETDGQIALDIGKEATIGTAKVAAGLAIEAIADGIGGGSSSGGGSFSGGGGSFGGGGASGSW